MAKQSTPRKPKLLQSLAKGYEVVARPNGDVFRIREAGKTIALALPNRNGLRLQLPAVAVKSAPKTLKASLKRGGRIQHGHVNMQVTPENADKARDLLDRAADTLTAAEAG